jgi:hypothetical protein
MNSCEVCGSSNMEPVEHDGQQLWQCGLCDHVHGDAEVLDEQATRDEAEERGFHPLVFPLVQALESIPTFSVAGASAGRLDASEYPFVFLRLAPGGLKHMEHLLTSLEMANQGTKRRWVVETALQRGLLFILRPRFWKAIQEINRRDIEESREDLRLLAKTIQRDAALGWWA